MEKGRVDKIEEKLNSLELKFGKFESKVTEKLVQIASDISAISTTLKDMFADQKEANQNIVNLSTTVHDNKQDIEELKKWRVQCEKVLNKLCNWRIQWGATIGTIVGAIGIISTILGLILTIKSLS